MTTPKSPGRRKLPAAGKVPTLPSPPNRPSDYENVRRMAILEETLVICRPMAREARERFEALDRICRVLSEELVLRKERNHG